MGILCSDGKLALIDYGQVKRLSDRQRLDLAKSILLVHEALKVDPRENPEVDQTIHQRARASVVNHARACGTKTENDLDETLYQINCVYLGRIDRPFLYPLNAIQYRYDARAGS